MHRPLVLLVATLALWPMATANHVQNENGKVVAFDHKTGNEWWVEVVLAGQDSGSVSGVQAMDDGGPWVALEKKSWGAWAATFHIEPGHRVQFRASWTGGAMVTSCWFTHPGGLEQCSTPPAFDAAFTNVKGNEWWVEATVTANQPLAGVDARVDCGTTWTPLTLRSWGAWAQTFHVPSGSKVDLRARSTSGAQDLSGGYIWPAATPTSACGAPPPAFDATFSQVSGNNWWVQVKVTANRPLAGVDARHECGAWKPLDLQSWGSWANSFFLPSNTVVDFRARSTTNEADRSGGYLWTSATPTTACPADPPQTPGWTTSHIHDGFPVNGRQDLAIGVVSNWYPNPALYQATFQGTYWTYWTGSAWNTEYLNDVQGLSIAVGDAERDGDTEIYVGAADGKVYIMVPSGPGGLQPMVAATIGHPNQGGIQTLTLADADHDGLQELYAVNETGAVYQIWRPAPDAAFQSQRIASIGVQGETSWFADGDRDGLPELYFGGWGGGAYRVEKNGATWATTNLIQLCCNHAATVNGIVAGDANGDGKNEVYAASADGTLRKLTWTGTAWNREIIMGFEAGLTDMTSADVDGDGVRELYVTEGWEVLEQDPDVWRVHWTGSAWVKTLLSQPAEDYNLATIVAGNLDGASGVELYAGSDGGDVYQVKP